MYKVMPILTSSGKYFVAELVTFENSSYFSEEFQDFWKLYSVKWGPQHTNLI